jgi:hypothetical protein
MVTSSGKRSNTSNVVLGSAVLLGTVFPQVVAYAAPRRSPIESVAAVVSGDLITAFSRHAPGVRVEYEFLAVSATDTWQRLRGFGPGDSIAWTPPGGGFRVAVLGLTPYQVAHHEWSLGVLSSLYPVAPPPLSSVRIEGPAGTEVPAGVRVTLTAAAYDASGRRLVDPGTATWSATGADVTPEAGNAAVLVAGPGSEVTVTATIGGKSATRTFDVYANPTAVELQIASDVLTLGSPASVTVDVLDAAGIDTGFNGTVDVADSVPELVSPEGPAGGGPSTAAGESVQITDGVGRVVVQGGPSAGTVESLSASGLSVPPGDPVNYGSAAIAVTPVVPPVPASIADLAYQAATVTSPGEDVVSTDPVVRTQQGTSLSDTGTYTLSGPVGATGATVAQDGTVSVVSGATDGVYTVTYSQGGVSESVEVTVALPLAAPTLDSVTEVHGGIQVTWSPAPGAGSPQSYEIFGASASSSGRVALMETVPSSDSTAMLTPAAASGGLLVGDEYSVYVVASAGAVASSPASASSGATYGASVTSSNIAAASGPGYDVLLTLNNSLSEYDGTSVSLALNGVPTSVHVYTDTPPTNTLVFGLSSSVTFPLTIESIEGTTALADAAGNPVSLDVAFPSG